MFSDPSDDRRLAGMKLGTSYTLTQTNHRLLIASPAGAIEASDNTWRPIIDSLLYFPHPLRCSNSVLRQIGNEGFLEAIPRSKFGHVKLIANAYCASEHDFLGLIILLLLMAYGLLEAVKVKYGESG